MVFVFALGQFSYLRRTHEGVNAVPTPAASGGLLTATQLGIIAWLPIAACFPYKAGCCLTVRRPGTFKVVLTDQPTAPCLYRSELAGAQQVVDEFSGDAQQFGGLLRAVGEPFGEGVTIEDFAHDGEQFLAHVAGEQSRYRACA
jgi:hypothetical protein